MIGSYFINERICLDGQTKEESRTLQQDSLQKYIENYKIKIANLNPYQLHEFYTIPHALLYDLKKNNVQLDCLLLYSKKVIEDFIYSYPARWLILKSYFKQIIILEDQEQTIAENIV